MKTWRRVIPSPSEIRPQEPLRKEPQEKPDVERTGSEPVEGQAWRRGTKACHPGTQRPGQPLSAPRTEARGGQRGPEKEGAGETTPEVWRRRVGVRSPPPGSIAVSEPAHRCYRPHGPRTHSRPFSAWQSGLAGVTLEGTDKTRWLATMTQTISGPPPAPAPVRAKLTFCPGGPCGPSGPCIPGNPMTPCNPGRPLSPCGGGESQ